jgi:hypothetical protein
MSLDVGGYKKAIMDFCSLKEYLWKRNWLSANAGSLFLCV